MKLIFCLILVLGASACSRYKRILIDEVVLKDGNTQTGKIISSDSTTIKLKKIDESTGIIGWDKIDTIKGIRNRTLWVGGNFGYYTTPYFSVFRNEALIVKNYGRQFKIGLASRGSKLHYIQWFNTSGDPYNVKKFGYGFQKYIFNDTYLSKAGLFAGFELNLMNVEYNNASQLTFDPFVGFDKKFGEQIRFHIKIGMQFNFANKNNQNGVNLSLGTIILRKNFKKQYDILNREHRLDR